MHIVSSRPESYRTFREPRFVGRFSPELRRRILNFLFEVTNIQKRSVDPSVRNIFKIEQSKPPVFKKSFEVLDNLTNRMLTARGVRAVHLPISRVHIVPGSYIRERMQKYGDEDETAEAGISDAVSHTILINGDKEWGVYGQAFTLAHEMLHLKSYHSIAPTVYEGDFQYHRKGFRTFRTKEGIKQKGEAASFIGLDEAITTMLQQRHFKMLIQKIPELRMAHTEQYSGPTIRLRKELSQELGIPIEDFFWVSKVNGGVVAKLLPYRSQCGVVNRVFDAIIEDNPTRFGKKRYIARGRVLNLFEYAYVTGRMLELARYIEHSFGKGAFRLLGTMGSDENAALLVDEAFRKDRAAVLRARRQEVGAKTLLTIRSKE